MAQAGFDEEDVDETEVNDVLAAAQAPVPGQAQSEVTTTYRGRPAVIKDGYTYIVKSTYNRTTYWRCLLVNNCKAAAKSADGSTDLIITNNQHTHDPDRVRIKVWEP